VGAGDHQHRHRPLDRLVRLAKGQPDHHRQKPSPDGEVEQQPGGPVGQGLGPRLRGLGLLDQPADPGQGRLLPDRLHPDPDRRVGDHRARHHRVARALGHRPGLPGDHRLVQLRFALNHRPVGRDPATRADQHHLPHRQLGDGHGLDLVAADPLGLVGQQRGQGVQGAGGLAEGPHLQPVAQQHDHDQ
jgi:hypothetical protein